MEFFHVLLREVRLSRGVGEAPSAPDSVHALHLGTTLTPIAQQSAFPTEARERQKIAEKAAKDAGIVKKPRNKKVVERHYDDCGESIASLGPESVMFEDSDDECPELVDDCSSDDEHGLSISTIYLQMCWFHDEPPKDARHLNV